MSKRNYNIDEDKLQQENQQYRLSQQFQPPPQFQQQLHIEETNTNPELTVFANVMYFLFGGGLGSLALYLSFGFLFAISGFGLPAATDIFNIARDTALPFGKKFLEPTEWSTKRLVGLGFWWPFGLALCTYHITLGFFFFFPFF